MPKLRKLRRKQKFQYNRNRSRIRKTQEATKNENIKVNCESLKRHWDARKPVKANFDRLGLAADPNKTPSLKRQLVNKAKGQEQDAERPRRTTKAVKQLEAEAEDAEDAKPKQRFRFSKEEVKFLTHLLDKHGDDFDAMAKDPKNVFQLTPKQIRGKIVKFINIPEQFAVEAKSRGLLQ